MHCLQHLFYSWRTGDQCCGIIASTVSSLGILVERILCRRANPLAMQCEPENADQHNFYNTNFQALLFHIYVQYCVSGHNFAIK